MPKADEECIGKFLDEIVRKLEELEHMDQAKRFDANGPLEEVKKPNLNQYNIRDLFIRHLMRGGVQVYQLTDGAIYHEPVHWFKNRSDCWCYGGPEKDGVTKDGFSAYIDHDGTTAFCWYRIDGTVDMDRRWCVLNTDGSFDFSPEPKDEEEEKEKAAAAAAEAEKSADEAGKEEKSTPAEGEKPAD